MFRASFKEFFKGGLKHINSLSKKVCFVVVVCHSSQLPEQKEGMFLEILHGVADMNKFVNNSCEHKV